MHRVDRDILWLQREFCIHLCNLLDTGQASRVLKLERNSLEHLLQHYFRVTIVYLYGAFDVESLVENLLGQAAGNQRCCGGDYGDRYHGDVDMFNKDNSIWSRLTVQGSLPSIGVDISICGRCGEDEHPIKELLVLQLGAQHPNVRYNMCTIFGSHWNLEEHSLLLSQYLSPSQSNQEQAPPQKPTSPMVSHGLNLFKPLHHIPSNCQFNSVPNN
ncbi:hypothetical protein Goari_000745, partial [Gossypium aridum]|nr:hypothetical protein [Gossypium aridum]